MKMLKWVSTCLFRFNDSYKTESTNGNKLLWHAEPERKMTVIIIDINKICILCFTHYVSC